jgi:hypothetical protein
MPSKTLVQQARIRTNTTKDSVCSVQVEAVTFAKLWSSYPGGHPYVDPKTGKAPPGFKNQCAIKVSIAIHGAGIEMKSFRGDAKKVNGLPVAYVAAQLAEWLTLQPFCGLPMKPENVTGKDWQDKIKGRTGIIYFANYWHREDDKKGPTGDHIDLWDKTRLTANPPNLARRLGISSIQWLPGPLADFNFSDLGNSTTILFWEVK